MLSLFFAAGGAAAPVDVGLEVFDGSGGVAGESTGEASAVAVAAVVGVMGDGGFAGGEGFVGVITKTGSPTNFVP